MNEKVKLPREVAEALEKSKHIGPAAIMGHLSTYTDAQCSTEELSLIYRYYKNNPYIMASAIINSYEVEETPEEKVASIFHHWNNHDGSNIYSGQSIANIIQDVIEILGHKIEGINK